MQRGNEATHAGDQPSKSSVPGCRLSSGPLPFQHVPSCPQSLKGACQSQGKPSLEQGLWSRWTVERSEGLAGRSLGSRGDGDSWGAWGNSTVHQHVKVVSNSFRPTDCSPWNAPDQNTGVGNLSLLQWICPTQESNQGLQHCRWILYQLSYQGSPVHLYFLQLVWPWEGATGYQPCLTVWKWKCEEW